jgi:hypothetical protein
MGPGAPGMRPPMPPQGKLYMFKLKETYQCCKG